MRKKLAAVTIALAMSLSMAACGASSGSTEATSTAATEASTVAAATETTAATTESAPEATTEAATEATTEATATYATLDAFNQVKEGMTLDEVNKIFGFEGTKAASGSAAVAGISSTAEVYTWAGETPGASASIGFQDGKVVSTAQAGLQ